MPDLPASNDVVVYSANGHLAGEMIRAFLESQGIPARLNQESAGLTYGLTIGPLGLVEILVPADRQDEARQVLEEMEDGKFELPRVEGEEGPYLADTQDDEEGDTDIIE